MTSDLELVKLTAPDFLGVDGHAMCFRIQKIKP